MVILAYYLERDDYMTEESGEDRYDVVSQFVESGKVVTQYEWENCTLEQARARLIQLYRTNPPEGVTQ